MNLNLLFIYGSLRWTIPCLVLFFLTFTTHWMVAAASDRQSVTDAKKSLSESLTLTPKYPWYSPAEDDSAFVPFPVEQEESRESQMPEVNAGNLFWGIGFGTMIVIALAILIFIVAMAWYVVHYHGDLFRRLWQKEELKERKRRIETLPEEARDMFDDLVGAARRAFEAGDYRKALVYYFSHQLVWLDTHELIRMHRGKTNHEYGRELSGAKEVRPYYEQAMSLFESVYYGEHPITRPMFLAIWEQRDHFKTSVVNEKRRRDEIHERNLPGKMFAGGSGVLPSSGGLKIIVDLPDCLPGHLQTETSSHAETTLQAEVPENDDSNKTAFHVLFLFFLISAAFLMTGCRQNVQTGYVPPRMIDQSINGISVFCDMCVARKHSLREGYSVNSFAKNADVMIWFARHVNGPDDKERSLENIEQWLRKKPGRTFVYVGRAFEADRDYWTSVESKAKTPDDRNKIEAKKLAAKLELQRFLATQENRENLKSEVRKEDEKSKSKNSVSMKNKMSSAQEYENRWFRSIPLKKEYVVRAVEGNPAWTDELDVEKLHLSCFEQWLPKEGFENELVSGEQTLVARKKVAESHLFLVSNAGFLLNYPLINHEHRKLAGRLIEQFGDSPKRIFVYMGFDNPDFEQTGSSDNASPHLLFSLLQIWPLSVVIWQVILIGTVFCFHKWPIFGRPKKLPIVQVTDFGMHLDAYADLLARAKHADKFVEKQLSAVHPLFIVPEIKNKRVR